MEPGRIVVAGYGFDEGHHKFTIGPALVIPMFNCNRDRGPIAEAEARRSEAAARFLAVQA